MRNNLLNRLKKSHFDTSYAKSKGVSPRMLGHYVSKGRLIRLTHGVYAFPDKVTFDFEGLIKEKLMQAPQAVVGLNSALKLYGLTEEAPALIDLFVPETNVPKKKMDDIHFHTVKKHLHHQGVKKLRGLPTTTIERTIVDFLRKNGSITQCLQIIDGAKRQKVKMNFHEMTRLATLFRVKWKAKILRGEL